MFCMPCHVDESNPLKVGAGAGGRRVLRHEISPVCDRVPAGSGAARYTGVRPDTMQTRYSIDTQENLLRLQAWGELTVDGLIALLNRAQADPEFRPEMNAIADYREANGEWDFSEVQKLRDYILRVEVPCEVRWAAVLKPGSLAAAGHVLIVISEAVGVRIKMRMFDDQQYAMRWIRREVD